jgi:hypothetical protein
VTSSEGRDGRKRGKQRKSSETVLRKFELRMASDLSARLTNGEVGRYKVGEGEDCVTHIGWSEIRCV